MIFYPLLIIWGAAITCRRHIGARLAGILILCVFLAPVGIAFAYFYPPNRLAWVNDYRRHKSRAAHTSRRSGRSAFVDHMGFGLRSDRIPNWFLYLVSGVLLRRQIKWLLIFCMHGVALMIAIPLLIVMAVIKDPVADAARESALEAASHAALLHGQAVSDAWWITNRPRLCREGSMNACNGLCREGHADACQIFDRRPQRYGYGP